MNFKRAVQTKKKATKLDHFNFFFTIFEKNVIITYWNYMLIFTIYNYHFFID